MAVDILRNNNGFIHQHTKSNECTEHGEHIETVAYGIGSNECDEK